ncbi:hypothetical protein M0R45_004691 [Rubus argutus]|uniref:Legume lectin domain-containing protein n=1 Tax=Rubus argutus TaxID=59490 RepID=A0AAW1YKM0_RUBAR
MSLTRLPSFRLHYNLNNSCSIIHLIIFIHFFFIPICHPLSFSMNRFDHSATNIIYEGDAAPNSGVIELNTPSYCRVGRATYAEPLHLWEGSLASDFTSNFSFTVDTLNSTSFADGFAFFLAPVHYPIPPNSNGPDLGLFNATTRFSSQNQLVTVEFDTHYNPEFGIDPAPGPHIGITNKTISSVVHANWDPFLYSGKEGRARITYNAATNNLSVFCTYDDSNAGNYSISLLIDLKKSLPEWVTIGFSSSTGLLFERHIIRSWEFISSELRRTYYDGEFHLPLFRWVWHLYLEGNLLDAADERLEMDFDQNEMECLLIVGLWCTHLHPRERPKAGQVIKFLQLEAPLPKLPHIMPEYPMRQPQQQPQTDSS